VFAATAKGHLLVNMGISSATAGEFSENFSAWRWSRFDLTTTLPD
jgi:hypothetical protein